MILKINVFHAFFFLFAYLTYFFLEFRYTKDYKFEAKLFLALTILSFVWIGVKENSYKYIADVYIGGEIANTRTLMATPEKSYEELIINNLKHK